MLKYKGKTHHMKKINKERGFVHTVLILIIALLILSYYGFDLKKTVEAPTTQSNFGYVIGIVKDTWHSYLAEPANYLWNDIFLKLIWRPSIRDLERVGNNEPTSIMQYAPQLAQPGNI